MSGMRVVLSPPGYNPPARVAERIAMLDLGIVRPLPNGAPGRRRRGLNWKASTSIPALKKLMWAEATEQTANMLAMTPYPGFKGEYFSMPAAQRHSQVVAEAASSNLACVLEQARRSMSPRATGWVRWPSLSSIRSRQRNGLANTMRSSSPNECVPIGHAVNANIAMATGFSVHHDEAEAIRRGQEGFQYFGYALGHHYVYGEHTPSVTNVWERFERARDALPPAVGNGIGTPAQLIERLRQYQDVGVDQVIFIQQAGRNTHDDIVASLELFAAEVMPTLKADQAARDARKQAELAPYIEAALKRKKWMQPLAPAAIPPIPAYGRSVVAGERIATAVTARRGGGINIPSEDPSERLRAVGDD